MELADRWLIERLEDAQRGDISAKSYDGSRRAVDRLKAAVPGWDREDLMLWVPDDFKRLRIRLAANVRPYTLANYIVQIRAMFNWGARVSRILPTLPDWGNAFRNVSVEEKERDRFLFEEVHGERRFELDEARRIIRACELAATSLLRGRVGKPHEDDRRRPAAVRRHPARRQLRHLQRRHRRPDLRPPRPRRRVREGAAHEEQQTVASDAVARDGGGHPQLSRSATRAGAAGVVGSRLPDGGRIPGEARHRGTIEKCSESDALRQATVKLLRKLGLKKPGVSFGAWRHTFISMSEEFGTEAIRNRITGHTVRGARHQYLKLRPEQLRVVTDGVRRMIFPDQTVTS